MLRDAVDAFTSYLTFELQRSPFTVSAYQKDLLYFSAYLNQLPNRPASLEQITAATLRQYLAFTRNHKKYALRTIARNIATLKSFFTFAESEGWLRENPARRLLSPRLAETMPRYLTPEEIRAILAAVDRSTPNGHRDYALLMTLYYTGLRVSELVQLEISDLRDWQDLVVRHGKGGRRRVIPLHGNLVPVLKSYLRTRLSTAPYLFATNQARPISPQYVRVLVKKYARTAGIDPARVSPHVFRHSFATALYKNGQVDLLRISKLLGHANLRATTIYTHTSAEHLREAIERL